MRIGGPKWRAGALFCGLVAIASLSPPAGAVAADQHGEQVARGAYLVRAAGCIACHTVPGGQPFAGGRALKTPFGTFKSPNITADRQHGIGAWSDADFLAAVKTGIAPDGSYLFPVFPYPSYARMTDDDALAIKAYLFSLPPSDRPDEPHTIAAPFSWRFLQAGWRALFFRPVPFTPQPQVAPEVNRGAYLVTALGHCGECHTPRNPLGGSLIGLDLAGTADGPDGEKVPNITPAAEGLHDWSVADIATLLKDGTTPDFDNVQGSMAEVVEDGTSHLTDQDRTAIAIYLKSLSPIAHKVE